MGLSTKDLAFRGICTLDDEREAEAFTMPEGTRWLWLIGRHDPIDAGDFVVRYVMKFIYFLLGLPTSAYHHEQGIVTTPEKAAAAAKSVSGGYAIRLPVDALFPEGRIDWKYQYKGDGLNLTRDGGEPELFTVVEEKGLAAMKSELSDWREGRRETLEVQMLRQHTDLLARLAGFERSVDAKLDDLDARVAELERGKGSECIPHRAATP